MMILITLFLFILIFEIYNVAVNNKPCVQPELYKKELVRQESAESSSTTEMEYAGKLHFALRYDKEIEGLVVKVSIISYFKSL